MNKKGLELMANTFVVIVLAILAAATLILFWDVQTGKFTNILNTLFGDTNVDSLVTVCNAFVNGAWVHDYCCVKQKVKYNSGSEIIGGEFTCRELYDQNFTGKRINKLSCTYAGCENG